MEYFKSILSFQFWFSSISFISNILTITISCISLFVFITRREAIGFFAKSILNTLLHTTLYHIDIKINEAKEYIESENYELALLKINEIIGTIEGDKLLNKNIGKHIIILNKMLDSISNKTDFRKKKGNLIKSLSTIKQELKSIEFSKLQGD